MAKKRKPAATVEGDAHANGGQEPNGEAGLGAPNQGAPSADGEPGGGEAGGTYESRERVVHDDDDLDGLDEPHDDDLLDDEPSGEVERTDPFADTRRRSWEPSPATAFGAGLGTFERPLDPPPMARQRHVVEPRFPEPRQRRVPLTGFEPHEELPEPPYAGDDDDSVPPGQPGLFGGGYGAPPPKMPAWAKFTEYPTTHRLKVKRVEIDGRESDLGPVHPNITEEELIARWPRPQTLLLFPIDQMGKNLAPNNPVRLDIAEDHSILQMLRRRGRTGANGGYDGGGGFAPPESPNKDIVTLVQGMLEQQKLENQRLREEMRLRDERIERKEAMLNERANALRENETSLAVMSADQLRTSQDKLITGFEQRNNGLIEILARNAAEERARRHEEERADRERREENYRRDKEERDARHAQELALQRQMFEQQAARDQAYLERQREADKRDLERERLALEREEKRTERWNREQHAAMLERDKMRHEHMETLVAANGSGGLEKLAENIQALKAVTEELGGGGGDGESGGKGKIAEIGEALGDVVRAFKGVPNTVQMQGGGGGGGYGGGGEDFEGGPYGPPQLPGPPPGTLAIPPGYTVAVVPDPQTGQPTPVLVPMNAAAAAQGAAGQVPQQGVQGQQQQGQPGQVINMPGAPAGSTNQMAQAAGMQLPEVKAARDVIRQTVRTLKTAPQEAWQEIVVGALASSPQTISYLRAVSVFVAVKEGGADDILASDICLAAGPIAQQQGIPVRP